MRLIDADELKEFVKEKCWYCTSFINEENVLSWIDQAPTIDPNELDLDIDYSIEYDKRPDGISNAKVTITRIKPSDTNVSEAINKMPTADRPKGEWKWRHGGECSECGFRNNNFDFNFCPNCGADMQPDK